MTWSPRLGPLVRFPRRLDRALIRRRPPIHVTMMRLGPILMTLRPVVHTTWVGWRGDR